MEPLTVVIQAGGRSSRMGADKGLIPLNGRPLIEWVIERVAGLGGELLITTNRPEPYAYLGLPLFGDAEPGRGAAYGLQTALQAAQTPLVAVTACDMPFASGDLFRYQWESIGEHQAIMPRQEGRFQPFHAVYRREPVAAAVERALAEGVESLWRIFGEVDVFFLEEPVWRPLVETANPFFNINTPADLARAGDWLSL